MAARVSPTDEALGLGGLGPGEVGIPPLRAVGAAHLEPGEWIGQRVALLVGTANKRARSRRWRERAKSASSRRIAVILDLED